jgi:predicted ATPase
VSPARRDRRRFGPGPFLLGLRRDPRRSILDYRGELPVIAEIERLRFEQPVTLLSGDNGSGKSTVIELAAEAIGFAAEGGELERSGERPAIPHAVLEDAIEPVLSATKPRGGYFLRAESFFNVATFTDSGDRYAPDLSLYGDVALHQQSHGESFLALAANRFGADGLYILDEPEAALSVTGLLALVAVIVRAARGGAQFIVATHSPILLACPDARIYELDPEAGAQETAYDDLDAVRLTRGFLDAPERYLRSALAEPDDDTA